MRKLGFLLTLTALFAFACSPAEEPAKEMPEPVAEPAPEPAPEMDASGPTAVAVLHNAEGEVVGTATFVQAESAVTLSAQILGLSGDQDGMHGFHVHQIGECVAPDFKAAGGHFNPMETEHACPGTAVRHAGDFGNIEIAGGTGTLEIPSDLVTVAPGPTSVVGKAVILHAGTDDCAAQPTGAAGARLACGVIELKADEMAADAEGEAETAGADH